MIPQNKPVLEISQFGYADTIRADKNRKPGMCANLLNTAPNLSGMGERIRRGYLAYTTVTAPTGAEILQVAPIQSPSQEDVHIWFASNSGQKIYMNPYWHDGAKGTTNILINERLSLGATAFTTPTNFTLVLTAPAGVSAVSGYYKNWVLYNSTRSAGVIVTAWNGTDTFTTHEKVNGMSWVSGDTLVLQRGFHDKASAGLTTAYNTTLVDPPNVRADNSIIRLCGGQSSSANNAPIHITPLLSRTFFPSALTTPGSFTISETYSSLRKLEAMSKTSLTLGGTPFNVRTAGGFTGLPINFTYWVAYAPVFDNFQIGPLTEFINTDYTVSSGDWTRNYLQSTGAATNIISPNIEFQLSTLNKRITGIAVYMAQDAGDTHSTGRKGLYFFLHYLPFTTTGGYLTSNWGATSTGTWSLSPYNISGPDWSGRGETYVAGAGIVESPSDTMYNYSDEAVIGEYHFLSNLYISSESVTNRQELFTNPIGGSAGVGNAGVVQSDIFSNEQGIYRLRVQPTVGSKINGMRITGVEDLLILKDRGVIQGRLVETPENTVDFIWTVMSHDVGCATLKGHAFSDDGWIYCAGYDDIYRIRGAQIERLIESEDQNDWLYTYRETLTKAQKESMMCFYIPDRQVFFDIGQSGGKQVTFYPDYGWREVALNQSATIAPTTFLKWSTRLQNGTVLVIDSSGNIFQWSNPTTGAFYSTDNTQAIKYRIDTGDFVPSSDEAFDTILNRWVISRTFDSPTTGTLDTDLYKDGTLLRTYGTQDKTSAMIRVNSIVSDNRIGNRWRLRINSNSSPEVLNAGSLFTLNKIFLYGELRPRGRRATESIASTTGGGVVGNTIAGKNEILVNSTNTTGTWDIPFLKTYVGSEGSGQPSYRFEFEPPYILNSDKSVVETITIVSKSLTQIVLRSTSDATLVKFIASE